MAWTPCSRRGSSRCASSRRIPTWRSSSIFENKGEVVGVSNPHPHCQIYATNFTFKYIETELLAGRRHLEQTGRYLFQDILAAEQQDGRRIVSRHGSAIAFVPYFARYAYETYVAPLRSVATIADLDADERRDLATVLRDVVIRFDNLWRMPFPYVMALHQAPVKGDATGFHFHIEFHPPLRRPNLLKYLAGPEIGGGNFLSDTSPEEKAAELVAAGGPHYLVAIVVTVAHPLLAPFRPCIGASAGTSSRRASRRRQARCPAWLATRKGTRSTRSIASPSMCSSRRSARTIATPDAPVLLVAEGLPGGQVIVPEAARAAPRAGRSSSIRSMGRVASCTRSVPRGF